MRLSTPFTSLRGTPKTRVMPYPLIIFLHGAGGGNALPSEVMQSYEAARKAGKIQDFVVVFPEKYGGTVWRNGAKGKRPETNVLKELLPYLEKRYALTQDRRQRTIMGFSMGAAGSIYWGAKHLDIFSTAVALDAGGGTSFTDPEARNYVPEYGKKTKAIQKRLKLRLVQGGLNTRKFRDSLDWRQRSFEAKYQECKAPAKYQVHNCLHLPSHFR